MSEEVPEGPQRIEEPVALLGEQGRPHPLYGDLHPPEELPVVPGPIIDAVLKEIGDDPEQIFKCAV